MTCATDLISTFRGYGRVRHLAPATAAAVCLLASAPWWDRARLPILSPHDVDAEPVRAALLLAVVVALAFGRSLLPNLRDLEERMPGRLVRLRAGHASLATAVCVLFGAAVQPALGSSWAVACAANAAGLLGIASASVRIGLPYWLATTVVPATCWMFGTDTVADMPRGWAWMLQAPPIWTGIGVNSLLWLVGVTAWTARGPA